MQKYFYDSTDVGKLYINYPMVESYQHFEGWPDERFSETKVAASLEHGIEYKMLIRDMYVAKYMEWYRKVEDTLR